MMPKNLIVEHNGPSQKTIRERFVERALEFAHAQEPLVGYAIILIGKENTLVSVARSNTCSTEMVINVLRTEADILENAKGEQRPENEVLQ